MSSNFWQNRNLFISGASGLLGSWLTQKLVEEKARVTILQRDVVPDSLLCRSGTIHKVNVVRAELEDYWALERSLNEYEIDTVFHLGAQTIVPTAQRSPLPTFESNIRGTWNLLEAVRHSQLVQRTVIASSDKAYGYQKKLPYTEEMPLQGEHPYDVSKSCADLIAQSYFKSYGMAVGIMRCGNIYGGGDLNFNRIIPGTIRAVVERKSPVIRSDGKYIRDYVYVKDVVRACLVLAEKLERRELRGEAFNFSTKNKKTVLEVVQSILKLMKSKLKPHILNSAKGEIREQTLSTEKAKKLLGWEAEYELEKGLEETIRWYARYFQDEYGK